MGFYLPPPFGDAAAMAKLADVASEGGVASISRLLERAAKHSLQGRDRPNLIHYGDPEDAPAPESEALARFSEALGTLCWDLSRAWGECASRLVAFASWQPSANALAFTDRLLLFGGSMLGDGHWLITLVQDADESWSPSTAKLSEAQWLGDEGSFITPIDEQERRRISLLIARDLEHGQSFAVQALAREVERLYLAYHRYCCHVETTARLALDDQQDGALGPLFGQVVASMISVVAVVEAVAALHALSLALHTEPGQR